MAPDGQPRLEVFHWGLIPVWAKERKLGQKMINARAETLTSKPAFKGVFKKHRLLIPMDGFYEWQAGAPGGPVTKAGKPAKQPMYIERLRRAVGCRRPVVGVEGPGAGGQRLAPLGVGDHDLGQRDDAPDP